jgi:5'-nucleotidase / UDP-sugar diphosphatase
LSSVNCRKMVIIVACLALACTVFVTLPSVKKAEADGALRFTILHTNDEHSELIPYGPASDYPDNPTTGGFARLATLIGGIRSQKASAGEPVLTMSAGDFSMGTLFDALETSAAPELTLFKDMGYDAVAIGNHEFDLGPSTLKSTLDAAKAQGVTFPLLCANINIPPAEPLFSYMSETDLGGTDLKIQRYTIKTLSNGLKVGIFGLLGANAQSDAPAAKPVTFLDTTTKSQEMVNTLRAAGCQVVIALSHCGTSEETQLASSVSGIDVIVGGHSHDLNYPPITVGNTTIVQAESYCQYLGDLELEYSDGKVSVRNATAIPINQNTAADPAINTAVGNYVASLNATLGINILAQRQETDIAGDGGFALYDRPSFCETNVGDLVTDAYRATLNQLDPAEPVQIAVESNGVIRAGLPKGASGRFSFYDMYRTIGLGGSVTDTSKPGYDLVSFYLLGAELQGVLSATLDIHQGDYFIQVSGAKYKCDPGAPGGHKLLSFKVQNGDGTYSPINPSALYKIAVDYYTASFLESFGVKPRDKLGTQKTVADFKIIVGGKELRCWEALDGYLRAMPDLDGDGLPNVDPIYESNQGRIQSVSWYLAEGSTDGGMETFVLVQNPGAADVHVNVKFETGSKEIAPAELQGIAIPANSRVTVKANSYVTDYNVSTKVETLDGEVVVERSMYGNNRSWAHDSIGVNNPAASWYLPEGSTDGGMETWVLVQNPEDDAVRVNIKFQTDKGEVAPDALQGVNIPANSRRTFKVNDYVTSFNVSSFVETVNGGVVVERSMYGNNRNWGTDSIGASSAAPEWYLAEGCTDGGMETFLLLQNPYSKDLHVNIKFQTDSGEQAPDALQNTVIPAKSRRTFKVNDFVTSYNVSTYVKCTDGNVLCERAMYGNNRIWAHDSIGVTTPAATWELAEGATGGGMETFVLMQNPGTSDVHVNIKFQTDKGELVPSDLQGFVIPAKSRRTIKVNGYVTTYDVSTKVEATDGNIVCERAMYGNNRTWATESIGYSPLPL